MSLQQTYPYSNVKMLPGDILYSSIGKSTYYGGHIVIIGPDYNIIESLPGKPSGHTLTPYQYWHRHNQGDKITFLRSKNGASDAAKWAYATVGYVETYTGLNYNPESLMNNSCSKWILPASSHGANITLTPFLNTPILPPAFKQMKSSDKVAVFLKVQTVILIFYYISR